MGNSAGRVVNYCDDDDQRKWRHDGEKKKVTEVGCGHLFHLMKSSVLGTRRNATKTETKEM